MRNLVLKTSNFFGVPSARRFSVHSIGLVSLFAANLILGGCGFDDRAVRLKQAEAEVNCVAEGGFLVPVGEVFDCELPNGQVLPIERFYE